MLELIKDSHTGEEDFTIRNVRILSPENGWRMRHGNISVRGSEISSVGPRLDRSAREYDGGGAVVMPGLVNGHCHGDMTIVRGLGDDMTLLEQNMMFAGHNWFQRYLSENDRFISRQLTYSEALLSGTTFFCENMYWSLGRRAIDAMEESGISGALAEDLRPDFRHSDNLHSPDWIKSFAAECRSRGILPLAGGISEEDFSYKNLKRFHDLAGEADLRETRHFSETTWRVDLIKERFGVTPTEMLDHAGLLRDQRIRQILSHGVWLSERDIALLKESHSGIVNTPISEVKIGDGMAPLAELLEAGVDVGLGTDGALWNNRNDLFREMRMAALLSSLRLGPGSLVAEQALDMGTIGGARVFGVDGEIGSLEPGKRADFIVLDINQPHFVPLMEEYGLDNLASLIVYNASGQDVTDVFVRGKRIVRDRRLTTLDLNALMSEVGKRSSSLAKQLRQVGNQN